MRSGTDRVVVGFVARVQGSDGGDDVDAADGRDLLVESVVLRHLRALEDDGGDAVATPAAEERHAVLAAHALVGAHASGAVALRRKKGERKENRGEQFVISKRFLFAQNKLKGAKEKGEHGS